MTRPIRYLPHPRATVEITQRTAEGRFLFRPSEGLNALIAGCLSRAQKVTGASVHAVAVMSNHFHLLATFDTVEQMANFMCHLKTNLSKEIRRYHGWRGAVFEGRYRHIPLSDEVEVQIQRLKYILRQGTKEGLVLSPRDWPGVHCAKALERGEPLRGIWVNRTQLYRARQKDNDTVEAHFIDVEELRLVPLPCWAEATSHQVEAWISDLIQDIEAETREMHQEEGTVPLGAEVVCQQDPLDCAGELARSAKPSFHATPTRRRTLMRDFRDFVLAYRAAADRIAAGYLRVEFPENCYPPDLPFVEPTSRFVA